MPAGTLSSHHNNKTDHDVGTNQGQNYQNGDFRADHDDGPPLKRRKVAGQTHAFNTQSRLVSPPWKKVGTEGPTSFVENGRRKSGRTNVIPLELQPQADKRQTRAAIHKVVEEKVRQNKTPYGNLSGTLKNEETLARRPMSAGKVMENGPGRPASSPGSPIFTKSCSSKPTKPLHKHPSITRTQPRYDRATYKSLEEHVVQPVNGQHQRDSPRTSSPLQTEVTGMGVSDESGDDEEQSSSESESSPPSPPIRLQKIKFTVRMPKPAVQSPGNIPQPKKYGSFQEFVEKDLNEPVTGQDLLVGEIKMEAIVRRRVRQAQRRGGILHKQLLQALPDKPKESRIQFAHYDHLLAHIGHFRQLLHKEHHTHKRQAKKIAEEAVKYLERKQQQRKVKTEEELEQEEMTRILNRCREVVKDLERQWALVEAEVNKFRFAQWEEEQRTLGKERLDRVLEENAEMLRSRIKGDLSETEVEDDHEDESSSVARSDSAEEDEDESNMSSSGSESDIAEVDDRDADLTAEQLRQKYASMPVPPEDPEADVPEDHPSKSRQADLQNLLTVEEEVLIAQEDSDPSIDMDSGSSESDTSTNSHEDDSEEDEEEDDNSVNSDTKGNPLLALFSRKEIAEMKSSKELQTASWPDLDRPNETNRVDDNQSNVMDVDGSASQTTPLPPSIVSVNGTNSPCQDPAADGRSNLGASVEVSTQASPRTSATKASEVESFSSVDPTPESVHRATPSETNIKTPVPSLLRGTLRAYQHFGLDWLAEQYVKGRNGILADEMGLGKTIQSIALLAHLAEVHEVWGPHLIIVPTSVMLNWEMEFKKFCPGFKVLTYYGSIEERKNKRRGWQSDRPWHVLITSYQLILQDQIVFKRYNWHYMILDEAHNIKNFHSQRWQTMLTFKTRARLLLTGTPLQNNLMELWSLLFFLRPSDTATDEEEGFAGLKEFSEWFRNPVNKILEHGREAMSNEDRAQVVKLHQVIRPYILRRLKADVEKQMPAKYEHVELCRLSKRQRQLYDGFMSRAQTKETLASGNYLSIINCLMQLRKVCNHPDLFETRPITTSFAMAKSAIADFEIQDLLVRRKVMREKEATLDLDFLHLAPVSQEDMSHLDVLDSARLMAYPKIQSLRGSQYARARRDMRFNGSSTPDVLASIENVGRQIRMAELERDLYFESQRHRQRPIYGQRLLDRLSLDITARRLPHAGRKRILPRFWESDSHASEILTMVKSYATRALMMEPLIQKFGCITPAVVATDMAETALSIAVVNAIREAQAQWRTDPFHQAQTRLAIAFPDKRLLQYDCGKLQRLDRLLRDLQAGGHRALIFTQMTKVLDILEQFLNIHGHRYLRLDGSTGIEKRQSLTERFNTDTRILAFILSSRSGGLGINLTGADTVIFYDLDWNPAMDKQCQDRCHRIGQTRDVHIYRFVSEHTIEANILRKSNQKRMLDDVVIQEGDFTTDYFNKLNFRDVMDDEIGGRDEASAAMDRVLGNEKSGVGALEQVEDKEDVELAKVAEKQAQHADDGDFDDRVVSSHEPSATPRTTGAQTPGGPFEEVGPGLTVVHGLDDDVGHIDNYMVRLKRFLLQDVPIIPESMKSKKTKKKGGEHHLKRVR